MKINKTWLVLGILGGATLFLGGCPLMIYHNRETGLRKAVEAQQKNNENIYDRVWKTISQQAQVADKYADQFKEIYIGIMENRYQDGEARLAKFVTENSPTYSPDLMKTLMITIESSRKDFERAQAFLIDKKREHDLILEQMPAAIYTSFILGRKPIQINIVTSTKTEESFKSGKDDDVNVFKENK